MTIDTQKYKVILNWLIDNHPSYRGMMRSESCPQPILFSGFVSNTNNTDKSDKNMKVKEDNIAEEQMTFASSIEPTESTIAFQNES